ncbi:hypothetical protein ACFO0A_12955 [Novosphingobium tardum]|uniref:Cupin domain-containing protein n=1 Tax=Novosphingobium tardum TaxID=1538021 RepID=A0ABV8RT80_9SPHN
MPNNRFTASDRLIRLEDLVPCTLAFIDCKIPGSDRKVNYSIIGAGVTQSREQFVNLAEPHGFALGVAAMPNGVTNNLHMHYTAEVFMIYRGEWLFRWGPEGNDGEITGREGDVLSMPTWMFRGFTNVGPDDSWIFTLLGRDNSGGVVWHPSILELAADQGLYLTRDNMMVDTAEGKAKPADAGLIQPLSPADIAAMRRPTPSEMARRVVRFEDLAWSDAPLLDSGLAGHASFVAPVIGAGMTEDRNAVAPISDPHGFMLEYVRLPAGNIIGTYRIAPKQVLIVRQGKLEIQLGDGADATSAVAEPWSTFSVPANTWRTFRSVGDEEALFTLTTAGDARPDIEWSPDIVAAAMAAGVGLDPNGYIAPAHLLPTA